MRRAKRSYGSNGLRMGQGSQTRAAQPSIGLDTNIGREAVNDSIRRLTLMPFKSASAALLIRAEDKLNLSNHGVRLKI